MTTRTPKKRRASTADRYFDAILDAVTANADAGSISGKVNYKKPARSAADLELTLRGVPYVFTLRPRTSEDRPKNVPKARIVFPIPTPGGAS